VVTDAVPESEHDLSAGIDLPTGTGSSPDSAGLGLAVIVGLADDVRIESSGPGTSVTMSWKRRSSVS
jgi:anti-sigma regulatory factor (Ser/Thr protein kinase)